MHERTGGGVEEDEEDEEDEDEVEKVEDAIHGCATGATRKGTSDGTVPRKQLLMTLLRRQSAFPH